MNYLPKLKEAVATLLEARKNVEQTLKAVDEARTAHRRALKSLKAAEDKKRTLQKLHNGKIPHICGEKKTYIHHGDDYKVNSGSYIEELRVWKQPTVFHKFAYVVRLEDDGKTWKTLVYLDEHADIKASVLRKLLKLSTEPV